ncbi:DUF1616 domain-containing protein [Streptomyces maremycinicus]|uniref:DUF1616 domain-containing protein n=1 Tax=Streptomyces maremycinicus TaxID=1679753 RepID=UPI001F306EBE|nr:DUF1616 domain-containing protein [Streptomyces sp. NBRC 110468]
MTTTDSEDIGNGNTADGGGVNPGHGHLGHGHLGSGHLGSGVAGDAGRTSETGEDGGAGAPGEARVSGETKGVRFTSVQLRALVAVSGWSALAATAVPGPSPLRWIPVLLFVLFGPGCAALYPQPGPLASGARLEAVALAAPVSLSLGVLTATSLFLVEAFSMTAFLVSLACFTTLTAALPGLPLPAARRGAVERAGVRRGPYRGSGT